LALPWSARAAVPPWARRGAPAPGMCASVFLLPSFSSVPSSSYWPASPHGDAGHADVLCCAVIWLGSLLCLAMDARMLLLCCCSVCVAAMIPSFCVVLFFSISGCCDS
jgi:hypothetical protein